MSVFSFPKVQFRLNKQLDKNMAYCFLGTKAAGIDFGQSVLKPHPKLAKSLSELEDNNEENVKNIINAYFDEYYNDNSTILREKIEKAQKQWDEVSSSYFDEVSRIFNNHKFPEGKYIAYVSIINCNPRFLDDKTFQFYFKHDAGPIYITCHELLHFIFYDYVSEKLHNEFKTNNPEESPLWDIAEIFNSVVLHTEKFEKIHKYYTKVVCYPAHQKYLEPLRKEWSENTNIEKFITKALYIIQHDPIEKD